MAKTHKILRGSCPLVLTPFKDNEDLDLDALKLHIDWLIDKGAPGLFLAGSWGEYSQLSDDERRQVFETGLKHVAGRVPVFVGICGLGQTTRASVEFGRAAEGAGADGLMVKQYLYIDASERHGKAPEADIREGLLEYFGAMSRAVDIPIMLYNSVWGTVAASPEAQLELTDRGYIQYVKECTGIVTMQQTIGLCGDRLSVFNGMEDSAFPAFVLGLWTRALHPKALLAGWACGLVASCAMAYATGFNSNFTIHAFGGSLTGFIALYALVVNLAVCGLLTLTLPRADKS